MVPIIQKHGGSIDKFLGDGIMATFGVALKTEAYAADALRATIAILEEVDAWNNEREAHGKAKMGIGTGLAIGPVVYGAVGDASRLEYTVIGNAVNLSAKLEKHNKIEGSRSVTTAEALALAVTQGFLTPQKFEHKSGCRIEGVRTPLDLAVYAARGTWVPS